MEEVKNPRPSSMTILMPTGTPAIHSKGDTDYLCAGCSKTMLRKVRYKQVQNIVFKCPHCGTYSRVSPTLHMH